jgi:hypothetical protein
MGIVCMYIPPEFVLTTAKISIVSIIIPVITSTALCEKVVGYRRAVFVDVTTEIKSVSCGDSSY